MSFIKGIFKGRKKDTTAPRSLDHPRDLQSGDIVKLGFAAQEGIGNRSFTVETIATCDLGGEGRKKTVFTIESAGERFRAAVVRDGVDEWLEIARQVLPDDVQQVFDVEDFINLLDPDTGVNHVLERTSELAFLAGWTAPVYRQEAGHNAYYYSGDYRDCELPHDADEGEAFSYYLLVSDDRKFALEVQVYDGGRTEVYLIVYLPVSKIEELWPVKG
jgi:hypothetical protein